MSYPQKDGVVPKKQRQSFIEEEAKFKVEDVSQISSKLRDFCSLSKTEYVRDVIYGMSEEKKKIRLRIRDNFSSSVIEAIYKYKVPGADGIKTEIEETIYMGSDVLEAKKAIAECGDFKEENSYEKIRVIYLSDKTEICLDIYPYGVWLEIEGKPEDIWDMAKKLGYELKDHTDMNADELYLDWNKKWGLKEFWDVRFGLTGER